MRGILSFPVMFAKAFNEKQNEFGGSVDGAAGLMKQASHSDPRVQAAPHVNTT